MNKRHYKNLLDSIVVTLFLFLEIAFLFAFLWSAYLTSRLGDTSFMVCGLSILGPPVILVFLSIWLGCYEYWTITDDKVIAKKPLRRKRTILFSEIEAVERKMVVAMILGLYQSEAFIIMSAKKKIVIYITKKNEKFLSDIFKEYM